MKPALLLFLFCSEFLFAQEENKKVFPTSVFAVQHAGSIGWITTGYFRQSTNQKFEVGLLYGYTPEARGGEIHSIALKCIYEPFKIEVYRHMQIEPLQTGVFMTQNFSKNIYISWPDKYDPGYYWWTDSRRFHLFLGSQASYVLDAKVVKKISFYFETNTNDLYIFSYFGNHNWKSLDLDDIFFFGIGSKIYFE